MKNDKLYTTFFDLPFGNYFYFIDDEDKTIYQKLSEDTYYEPIHNIIKYPARWTIIHEKIMALDVIDTDEGLRINYLSNMDTPFDKLKIGQLFKPLDWGNEIIFVKISNEKAVALKKARNIFYSFNPNETVRIVEPEEE